MVHFQANLKTWLRITVVAFLLLVVIFLALPLPFMVLGVPSFATGEKVLWLVRWQNDASGSGIEFNLVPLLIVAALVGVVGMLRQRHRDRHRPLRRDRS